jgi:hypothetical protein
MAEQWLSIVEYARTYSVSDMTVRRRIKTGKLHAVLKDGKYFIPIAAGQASAISEPETVSDEMVIVRAHPQAQSTIAGAYSANRGIVNPVSSQPKLNTKQISTKPREDYIPKTLSKPMEEQDHSLVDTRALLAFCEASIRKFSDLERRQVEKFKAKLENVESQLQNKDQEISQLKQQVEDLQLLVKIIESKK